MELQAPCALLAVTAPLAQLLQYCVRPAHTAPQGHRLLFLVLRARTTPPPATLHCQPANPARAAPLAHLSASPLQHHARAAPPAASLRSSAQRNALLANLAFTATLPVRRLHQLAWPARLAHTTLRRGSRRARACRARPGWRLTHRARRLQALVALVQRALRRLPARLFVHCALRARLLRGWGLRSARFVLNRRTARLSVQLTRRLAFRAPTARPRRRRARRRRRAA